MPKKINDRVHITSIFLFPYSELTHILVTFNYDEKVLNAAVEILQPKPQRLNQFEDGYKER